MGDVSETAALLEAAAAPILNDLDHTVSNLVSAEASQVIPAETTCENLDVTLTSLETQTAEAEAAASDVQSSVATTQSRIANVIASFNVITTLNSNELTALRVGVFTVYTTYKPL